MKKTKTYVLQFKRKRKGLTNYKKRLKLLLSGKRRLVIRKSLSNIVVQIAGYDPKGDKVLLSSHSSELKKFGWKAGRGNVPSAYLTGLLLGKKAKENGIDDLVLDAGFNKSIKGNRIYAALKGVIDSGVKVPCSGDILPSEERIKGEHLKKYAVLLKKNDDDYKKRFSGYIKNSVDPENIVKIFEETKKSILGSKGAK